MDLYVERQYIQKMKGGEHKQFLQLFDANFDKVYSYVLRRVIDAEKAEEITRLTFMDALGQLNNTPEDVVFVVWLYSLAKDRVWDYLAHRRSDDGKQEAMPANILIGSETRPEDQEFIKRAEKMLTKMSLEETEILRLKFFEELIDGDLMYVLGTEEEAIGPKIYRVLKRAHFLLFGESDERHGVYFGELSGFMVRIKDLEQLKVPDVFRLNLRGEVEQKIAAKDFAIEAEGETVENHVVPEATGSDDPAKIFVEAVKEMREEEEAEKLREQKKVERQERFVGFVDRWRVALGLVPVVLLLLLLGLVVFNLFDFGGDKVTRPVVENPVVGCQIDVEFDGSFSDDEIESVTAGISNRICDNFEVDRLRIVRTTEGVVEVEVDVPDWMLEYRFVKKVQDWRIKRYERTLISNQQSGEV